MKRKRSTSKSRPKPNHKSKNTGPGKPTGIKSTDKQIERRIQKVADLICSGSRRAQIIETMCKETGLSWQMVQIYISRAREILQEETGRSRDEHRSEVFGKYQDILSDKKATRGDKLQALKGKREMLGLDSPRRSELSGPDGEALQITAAIDPDALELLSDDHINGILERLLEARKQTVPIIDLAGARRGSEPGPL